MTKISASSPESIQEMFSEIAFRYDLANDLISFGFHRLWKKYVIEIAAKYHPAAVLDCATGTGDLAFSLEKKLSQAKLQTTSITGVDFCEPMLEEARKKAAARHSKAIFDFGDATRLPFPDASYDLATMAFGIRNTIDPGKALSELARVVRPGGRILILEFGTPPNLLIRMAYRFYTKTILPMLGGWITGRKEAYRYLQVSSEHFPSGETFLNMAKKSASFSHLTLKPLFFGVAYLYELEISAPGKD